MIALCSNDWSEDDRIANDAVEEVDNSLTSVSIRGPSLCNVWFADDIDLLGGSEEELQ